MSNKYSIVTGASRGLGAAIAEELAREGYDVVITYCTQADKAQKVKKQLETKFAFALKAISSISKTKKQSLHFANGSKRLWAQIFRCLSTMPASMQICPPRRLRRKRSATLLTST